MAVVTDWEKEMARKNPSAFRHYGDEASVDNYAGRLPKKITRAWGSYQVKALIGGIPRATVDGTISCFE